MSFAAYEESTESGRPIQLYRFTLGANVWRYTNADEDLTIDGHVWEAAPISDDGVKQTGESQTDALNIESPDWTGPAAMYSTKPPSDPIQAEVLSMHEGMTAASVIYVGEVLQVNPLRPGAVQITCQTLSATMRRKGLRVAWQRSCPHVIYDPLTCKVQKQAYAQSLTISSIEGFMVFAPELSSKASGYFTGGFIEWNHPVRGTSRVMIEYHSNGQMQMFDETSDLYPGLVVTAYPGCPRTRAGCAAFNNTPNYGGFEKMPGKSPFDGIATPFF